MDQLEHYRQTIEKLLTDYYNFANPENAKSETSEASDRLALDREHDQYIWFRFGWSGNQKVQHIIMYLCIKNGKIWVEEDATNLCVVDDLLAGNIPETDIVLGFHPPQKRTFTEFAIA
jgi:XisI protein